MGYKENFEITALSSIGRQFLKFIKNDFGFCDSVKYTQEQITGKLVPKRKAVDEAQRLRLKNHSDIIRQIAFKFKPLSYSRIPYSGLFGAIGHSFIDQHEELPQKEPEMPSYELYFLDNLALISHKDNKAYIIANAMVMDSKREEAYRQCISVIKSYEKAMQSKLPKLKKPKMKKQLIETDLQKENYEIIANKIKSSIMHGKIFQAHLSRTIISSYNAEPLEIYAELKKIAPSPYMFFINSKNSALIGSSYQMFLNIRGDKEKVIEARLMSGAKPRGIINNAIDEEFDSKYEAELRLDKKLLSQHTTLIDAARNDIAMISKPGTRKLRSAFAIEKLPYCHQIASDIEGVLKNDIDVLHACLVFMNPVSLSGIPKIEALKILRENEASARGFYGGIVCCITSSGDFESAVIPSSILLANGKAHIKTGATISYDSVSKSRFDESEENARACMEALNKAGGLK